MPIAGRRAEDACMASQAGAAPRFKVAIVAARGAPVVVDPGGGYAVRTSVLQGGIHTMKRSAAAAPPKVFDANTLQGAVAPQMNTEECGNRNVCPHVHEYLLPAGKLR
jgi:hypothetical protein